MKGNKLISYEEALEILNGLPPPIRQSICERIVQYLTSECDELSMLAELPENHIERLIVVHRASNDILEGIHNSMIDKRGTPDAISKLIDK